MSVKTTRANRWFVAAMSDEADRKQREERRTASAAAYAKALERAKGALKAAIVARHQEVRDAMHEANKAYGGAVSDLSAHQERFAAEVKPFEVPDGAGEAVLAFAVERIESIKAKHRDETARLEASVEKAWNKYLGLCEVYAQLDDLVSKQDCTAAAAAYPLVCERIPAELFSEIDAARRNIVEYDAEISREDKDFAARLKALRPPAFTVVPLRFEVEAVRKRLVVVAHNGDEPLVILDVGRLLALRDWITENFDTREQAAPEAPTV